MRGYEVDNLAKARGTWVIYGGIHATLYPEEPYERGWQFGRIGSFGSGNWYTVTSAAGVSNSDGGGTFSSCLGGAGHKQCK